ncbi:MAG: FAD-binding oxidoreductase [Candidatus Aenigmarchaeota archaeon]|nr:FAD-binding oxidoreductase [Candidatus Aenigmarchaeota archaeon]
MATQGVSPDRTLPPYGSLAGPVIVDVAVIGCGIAGSACAYEFSRKGHKVALLEKGRVASGSSAAGVGILIPENGGIYDLAEEEEISELDAVFAYRTNKETMDSLPPIFDKLSIRYERTGGMGMGFAGDSDIDWIREKMKNEDGIRKKHGLPQVRILTSGEVKESGLIYSPNLDTAIFYPEEEVWVVDPVNFVEGLIGGAEKEGAVVYENSEVRKIERELNGTYRIYTNEGYVEARTVVVATQAYGGIVYSIDTLPRDDLVRSAYAHVISIDLTEEQGNNVGSLKIGWVESYDRSYTYLRRVGNRLIVGSESRATRSRSERVPSEVENERVKRQVVELYPQLEEKDLNISSAWGSYITYPKNSKDRLPVVEFGDHLYVIHSVTEAGFVKSMTIASVLSHVDDGLPFYEYPAYAHMIDARRLVKR